MNKALGIVVTVLAAAGGFAALATYLENRKSRVIRERVLALDKEIKELELSSLRSKMAVGAV